MSSTAKRIVIVVAKAPARGHTKTRLGATIGLDASAELYACLLQDVLDVVRRVPDMARAIAYLPQGSEHFFGQLAPDFELLLQQGDDLGARLDHALNMCLQQGYAQAAVMSSDTPLVDPLAIAQAFDALDAGHDVAIGPCDDGGYYLMAVKQPQPDLLRPIRMSTPRVLQDTLDAAAVRGLRVAMTPATFDIDNADDLARAREVLATMPPTVAARTRAWLQLARPLPST
jgi:rSAM/selenodomain-associated transferase 1